MTSSPICFCLFLLLTHIVNKAELQTATQCNYGSVLIDKSCVECGKTENAPNARIIGGTVAVPNSWPAQVLIVQYFKTDHVFGNFGKYTISSKFKCGGTLINSRTILTAAHCIQKSFDMTEFGKDWTIPISPNNYYPTLESMFKVYLGAHDISFLQDNTNPKPPIVEKTVSRIKVHESFSESNFLNDISLLILSSPVTLNAFVKLACLPKEQSNAIPAVNIKESFASGWGTLSEGGASPNVLYNVKLAMYDKSSCSNVITSFTKNWSNQLCSGDLSGKKDTCQGDSGGGLYVYDTEIKENIVAGVTSYGQGCANAGKPGVYTRVSSYMDWIRKNWESSNSNGVNAITTTQKPKPRNSSRNRQQSLQLTTLISSLLFFSSSLLIQ